MNRVLAFLMVLTLCVQQLLAINAPTIPVNTNELENSSFPTTRKAKKNSFLLKLIEKRIAKKIKQIQDDLPYSPQTLDYVAFGLGVGSIVLTIIPFIDALAPLCALAGIITGSIGVVRNGGNWANISAIVGGVLWFLLAALLVVFILAALSSL